MTLNKASEPSQSQASKKPNMGALPPDLLEDTGRLAVVGVAKNSGKTTALNYLLDSRLYAHRQVGLVSVGIDGETADLLIGTRKPPIRVRPGQWVVTARQALAKSTATIEFVAELTPSTPLGAVICGRVMEAGTVILAGMRHADDLGDAIAALEHHGVDLVMVDGAYGRTVAARAELCDAVIVSTGAVAGRTIDQICARTTDLLDRLAPAHVQPGWQTELIDQAIAQDRCLVGGPTRAPTALGAKSALLALGAAHELIGRDDVAGVAVPGVVSNRVVDDLLGAGGTPGTLLVPDGTVLQADARRLRRLERRWQVRAKSPARILAVTVNPTGPNGRSVDRAALDAALRKRRPAMNFVDPLHSPAPPT